MNMTTVGSQAVIQMIDGIQSPYDKLSFRDRAGNHRQARRPEEQVITCPSFFASAAGFFRSQMTGCVR
jgi:hypothetical protein